MLDAPAFAFNLLIYQVAVLELDSPIAGIFGSCFLNDGLLNHLRYIGLRGRVVNTSR